MSENSKISWTDHTFNPWEGCARVSAGCQHCYAEDRDKRYHGGEHWGVNGTRKMMSEGYWRQPAKWDRDAAAAGRPALVFCASLADVFEDRPELVAPRQRLFDLIGRTPNLIWLLLTKRPQNVLDLVPSKWLTRMSVVERVTDRVIQVLHEGWPSNVWVGTTVEDQDAADKRLPFLADLPCTRFISAEPLLGRVYLRDEHGELQADWVIVGGESGPGARPMKPDWVLDIQEQCDIVDVPFFFKQWGGARPTSGGDLLDGHRYHNWPPQAGDRT